MIPESLSEYRPFQDWLEDLRTNGHEIRSVTVEWELKVGPNKSILLFAIAHVSVFIPEENREKNNERIFMRPDINCVVAYLPKPTFTDTEVLLVKEFRSNTRNQYTTELPGGSNLTDQDSKLVAIKELSEETGFKITNERLYFFQSRQMVSGLATYKANVFAVELTEQEMLRLKADNSAYGQTNETERTFIQVKRLQEILNEQNEDWSTVGIILAALHKTR